jgi:hypothetical protein
MMMVIDEIRFIRSAAGGELGNDGRVMGRM